MPGCASRICLYREQSPRANCQVGRFLLGLVLSLTNEYGEGGCRAITCVCVWIFRIYLVSRFNGLRWIVCLNTVLHLVVGNTNVILRQYVIYKYKDFGTYRTRKILRQVPKFVSFLCPFHRKDFLLRLDDEFLRSIKVLGAYRHQDNRDIPEFVTEHKIDAIGKIPDLL